jgi:hypothetical protein
MIPVIRCVDLPIFLLLLLWGSIVSWIKEPGSGLRDLNANVCYCQQIGHRFRLLRGNLLDSLNIVDPITEGTNELDVLDVLDSVPGIAKIFHIIPKALIGLLLDSLQGFSSGGTLACALKVPNEHDT